MSSPFIASHLFRHVESVFHQLDHTFERPSIANTFFISRICLSIADIFAEWILCISSGMSS